MRFYVVGFFAVLTGVGMLAAQTDEKTPPGEETLEKQCERVRGQIEALQRKLNALDEEQKALFAKNHEADR